MAQLTERDLDIMESLTRRVRLLSIAQVRQIWWPGDKRHQTARRRLMMWVGAGLLLRFIINAHPPLWVGEPLADWQPGQPAPDPFQVSKSARSRWSEAAVPTEVFAASRRTANVFGSSAGQLPKLESRDHDLLLAEVYLHYRLHRPAEAKRWLGEDALPKAGYRIKDPDAFLIDDAGDCQRVIESTGRYAPVQVQSFHEHCVKHNLPYELW